MPTGGLRRNPRLRGDARYASRFRAREWPVHAGIARWSLRPRGLLANGCDIRRPEYTLARRPSRPRLSRALGALRALIRAAVTTTLEATNCLQDRRHESSKSACRLLDSAAGHHPKLAHSKHMSHNLRIAIAHQSRLEYELSQTLVRFLCTGSSVCVQPTRPG